MKLNIQKKKCSQCGLVLPLSQFHVDKRKPDGRKAYCSECAKKYKTTIKTFKKPKDLIGTISNITENIFNVMDGLEKENTTTINTNKLKREVINVQDFNELPPQLKFKIITETGEKFDYAKDIYGDTIINYYQIFVSEESIKQLKKRYKELIE